MDESGEKQAAEWQELDLSMRPVRESSLSAPAVTAILDQVCDKLMGFIVCECPWFKCDLRSSV